MSDGAQPARELVEALFRDVDAKIGAELADGTVLLRPDGTPTATLVFRNPGVLRALIMRRSDLAAGEAILRGDIAIRGNVESAFAAMDDVAANRQPAQWAEIARLAMRLPRDPDGLQTLRRSGFKGSGRKHSRDRDRAAVSYHYDLSNEFFALWLDRMMTYSCAYFRSDDDTLDEAQENKLDHICRKLRLRSGERLLDVGCGWGGLIRFAAREYGADCVGITLSRQQAEYARDRIEQDGLARKCTVELRDYRDLAQLGAFDKVASVGMFEHVGIDMLETYFRSAFASLRPGGSFLNHGIISQRPKLAGLADLGERVFGTRSQFIDRYVFPDGDLPRLDEAAAAASRPGFEVRDVENLREHYAKTLRAWVGRLEANEVSARSLVGDEAYTTWRIYMAGSARGFAAGRLGIVQILLAKRHADGKVELPMTRDDIYASRPLAEELYTSRA